jgi:RNA polymerase sigma-32 factor
LVVDEQDVVEMNRRLGGDSSLNTKAYDSDDETIEKIDLIADKSQNQEMSLAAKQELAFKKQILAKSLAKLNEREQYIVKNRMLTENPLTLDEIGEKFNISRERVRQIEKRAFEKLSTEVKNFMAA